jgi:hypothetical protein
MSLESLDICSFKGKKAFKFKARLGKLRHNMSPITYFTETAEPEISGAIVSMLGCFNNLPIHLPKKNI